MGYEKLVALHGKKSNYIDSAEVSRYKTQIRSLKKELNYIDIQQTKEYEEKIKTIVKKKLSELDKKDDEINDLKKEREKNVKFEDKILAEIKYLRNELEKQSENVSLGCEECTKVNTKKKMLDEGIEVPIVTSVETALL